ncbi:hypothetical protein [Calothrix sp. NIES-3974]|uniref:hypothetical protein n=1 Tax=Calothrix sp. NIES-3974 TaxID=2005462 RepID=UPI0012FD9C8C|nr:hypothetical protein [Calothrix sp. NIES-3974]
MVENADHLWNQCKKLGEKLQVPELQDLKAKLFKTKNKRNEDNLEVGVPASPDYPEKDYLELLGNTNGTEKLLHFSVPKTNSQTKHQITGEVYPLQLNDSFAIDITLRFCHGNIDDGENNESDDRDTIVDLQDIAKLNPDGFFFPENFQASLGQTLVLFTKLHIEENDKEKTDTDLALECLECLLSQQKKSISKKQIQKSLNFGTFLGSPIFEYDNGIEEPGENVHIIIWFNALPRTETEEAEGKYYQLLINLLHCRSRIYFAFSESIYCAVSARELYRNLKEKVEFFEKHSQDETDKKLQGLKDLLIETSKNNFDYTRHLRDLEIHHATILTNIRNYEYFLRKLKETYYPENPDDDLGFLRQVLIHSRQNLLTQIKVYQDYFNPSKNLYRETIDTIKALIAIIQTESDRAHQKELWEHDHHFHEELRERDRKFHEEARERDRNEDILLGSLGLGLGVSGVTSEVIPQPISIILSPDSTPSNNSQTKITPYLPFDILAHLILGTIFFAIAYFLFTCLFFIRRKSKNQQNQEGKNKNNSSSPTDSNPPNSSETTKTTTNSD